MLEGQPVQLACECHGTPLPTLSWWKDGRALFLSLISPHMVSPSCLSPWSKERFLLSRIQLVGGNLSCWEPEGKLLSLSLGR